MRDPLRWLLIPLLWVATATPAIASPADEAGWLSVARARFGAEVQVAFSLREARPRFVGGLRERTEGPDLQTSALAFLSRHAALFGLEGVVMRADGETSTHQNRVVRLRQTVDGLDVVYRGATVVFDATGATLHAVHLDAEPVALDPAKPLIAPEEAVEVAHKEVIGRVPGAKARATLVLLAGRPARRAYHVAIPTLVPLGRVSVFVDAEDGTPLWVRRDGVRTPAEDTLGRAGGE